MTWSTERGHAPVPQPPRPLHGPFPEVAGALRARIDDILRGFRQTVGGAVPALPVGKEQALGETLEALLRRVADALEAGSADELLAVLAEPPALATDGAPPLRFDPIDLLRIGRILRRGLTIQLERELGRALTGDESGAAHTLLDLVSRHVLLPAAGKDVGAGEAAEDPEAGQRDREMMERARVDAEEQLRRSHDTFFNLIQDSPFGIYIVDSDFRLRQVAAGAQKVFQNVRPLLGRDFSEVLRAIWEEPFASKAVGRFRHTLETGEPYVARDTTERRQDISEIESYDWRIERITLPDGEFGVVCYFYDLSGVKRAEEELRSRTAALRDSEERLRVATAAAHLGLHDFNVREGTVEWDARTREFFGVGLDEPITYEVWRESLHPDDVEKAEAAVRRALDPAGDGQYFAQYRVVDRAGGAVRWIEATGHTTFVEGEGVRLVGTVQDITERKRGEEALKAADRRKDEFIATLAHELRNPLAPIRMAVNILEDVRDDPKVFGDMIGVITRQVGTMTRLIDDLLDVSRITRGKIALRKEPVDVAMLIAHASEAVRPSWRSQDVELVVELPDRPVTVRGDPVRLAQVVSNLLSNAGKFTRRGHVRVSAARQAGHVFIRVEDTGSGIAPEDQERVFEMFAQAGRSGQKPSDGLGLGLPLARALVRRHGGDITLSSELGKGSVFAVRLPAAGKVGDPGARADDVRRTDRGAGPEGRLLSPPTPRNVLVVDDNLDVLAAVRTLLRAQGHEVQIAPSGERALEVAEQERPDVVVLDIGLPEMDGYEVARAIRRLEWGVETLLIAMTGWGQPRDKELAGAAGFDHHLTKPADPERLKRIVGEARSAGPDAADPLPGVPG